MKEGKFETIRIAVTT